MTKKVLAALLSATALLPGIAQAQDGDRGPRRGGPRAEAGAEGGFRGARRGGPDAAARAQTGGGFRAAPEIVERQPRPAGPRAGFDQRQREAVRDFRAERRDDRQDFRRERRDDVRQFWGERQDDRQALRQGQVTAGQFRADRRDDRQDFRADRRDDRRDFRVDRRDDRADLRRDLGNDRWRNADRLRQRSRADIDWRDQARADQRWGDRGSWNGGGWNGSRGGWNRDWRRDARYNWGAWRGQNRNFYRLPRYYAPAGWGYGYRRFSIGVTLSSMLFAQNYWIGDPYAYRLPPVDGPYRWVRYYNDALLVDVRYGEVVDVVYDIFW